MKKIIGIIGGMGPLATADLFEKIIRATDAARDQDFPHVIVDCNTDIPDRTAAILMGGEDPVPQLVRSANTLAAAGADVLIMPCNTAHWFYDDFCLRIHLPVLHMLRLTAEGEFYYEDSTYRQSTCSNRTILPGYHPWRYALHIRSDPGESGNWRGSWNNHRGAG